MIKLGEDMKPTGTYSVAFYIPEDFQGKAPAPTSNDVKVYTTKSRKAYVASFGGFATEAKVLEVRLPTTALQPWYSAEFQEP